jgi:hypothetical protein
VILPLTVIRRLDCVLEATKQAVLDKHTLLADRIENLEPESAGHCERQHGGLVSAGSPGHPAAITQGG